MEVPLVPPQTTPHCNIYCDHVALFTPNASTERELYARLCVSLLQRHDRRSRLVARFEPNFIKGLDIQSVQDDLKMNGKIFGKILCCKSANLTWRKIPATWSASSYLLHSVAVAKLLACRGRSFRPEQLRFVVLSTFVFTQQTEIGRSHHHLQRKPTIQDDILSSHRIGDSERAHLLCHVLCFILAISSEYHNRSADQQTYLDSG